MNRQQTARLLKGVVAMLDLRESDTYQEILEEGEARGLIKGEAQGKREFLRRIGSRRFGAPGDAELATLAAITQDSELDRLADRLFDVENWHDLLA
jgi:predicted transposase YdaD